MKVLKVAVVLFSVSTMAYADNLVPPPPIAQPQQEVPPPAAKPSLGYQIGKAFSFFGRSVGYAERDASDLIVGSFEGSISFYNSLFTGKAENSDPHLLTNAGAYSAATASTAITFGLPTVAVGAGVIAAGAAADKMICHPGSNSTTYCQNLANGLDLGKFPQFSQRNGAQSGASLNHWIKREWGFLSGHPVGETPPPSGSDSAQPAKAPTVTVTQAQPSSSGTITAD